MSEIAMDNEIYYTDPSQLRFITHNIILFLKISNVTDQISIKFSSEGWVIFNNMTKIFVLFYHYDDHHLLRVISILHLCSVQYVTEYFDYQERIIQNSFWYSTRIHGTNASTTPMLNLHSLM